MPGRPVRGLLRDEDVARTGVGDDDAVFGDAELGVGVLEPEVVDDRVVLVDVLVVVAIPPSSREVTCALIPSRLVRPVRLSGEASWS